MPIQIIRMTKHQVLAANSNQHRKLKMNNKEKSLHLYWKIFLCAFFKISMNLMKRLLSMLRATRQEETLWEVNTFFQITGKIRQRARQNISNLMITYTMPKLYWSKVPKKQRGNMTGGPRRSYLLIGFVVENLLSKLKKLGKIQYLERWWLKILTIM